MITVGAFGLGLGAVLSQSFRVFVLIPGSLFAVLTVVLSTLTKGYYFIDILALCVDVICALNVGYLLGLSTRRLFLKEPKAVRSKNAWLR
jgi:hypothetical protein